MFLQDRYARVFFLHLEGLFARRRMIRDVKTFPFKDDRRRAENLPDLLVSIWAGYTTWIVAK